MECLEAFACVVTPTATLSRPKVDLGTTYLGVAVRTTLTLKNLSLLPIDYNFSVEAPPDQDEPLAEMRIKPESGRMDPGG